MSFLDELAKVSKNEYATIVENGTTGDCVEYLDSGVYLLNALMSGSIYGGFPGNRITAIAGESSTGKTYFALSVVRTFLEKHTDGGCVYFESESALRKEDFVQRGVDASRVVMLPVTTVQDFKTQAVRVLDKYMETPKEERKPLMFVLDSLGMLSTTKEVNDAAEGKDVRDMTRSQLIRGAFRVITLKLGQANVPLLVTNHTYDVIGQYVSSKEMGGGCLVAGTKIQTENGSIPIENIQIGDKVRTMFGYSPVIDTFEFDDKEVYEMELEDGEKIRCSSDHKFLVDTGNGYEWKKVIELSPLDVIKSM